MVWGREQVLSACEDCRVQKDNERIKFGEWRVKRGDEKTFKTDMNAEVFCFSAYVGQIHIVLAHLIVDALFASVRECISIYDECLCWACCLEVFI